MNARIEAALAALAAAGVSAREAFAYEAAKAFQAEEVDSWNEENPDPEDQMTFSDHIAMNREERDILRGYGHEWLDLLAEGENLL